MGLALEMISGRATAPGATLTALTMAAGNSLTVRNTALTADIFLLDMWAFENAAGIFRIRSPKLHDNVQGIRYRIVANDPVSLFPRGEMQRLTPQDTLIAEISGSAAGGQIEQGFAQIFYRDLPGSQSRMGTWADIAPRIVNVLTNEVAITAGAGGGYTGQVAINSTFDLLQANTDYAILGIEVDVLCGAIRIQGPDLGNLGVGVPGYIANRNFMGRYFKEMSLLTGLPCIPVFNSANKAGTLVDCVQNQAAAAINANILIAQLAPR